MDKTNDSMKSNENMKAGVLPAVKAGGMRISQNNNHVPLKSDNKAHLSASQRQAMEELEGNELVKDTLYDVERQQREANQLRQTDLERNLNSKPMNNNVNLNNINNPVFQPKKNM